MKRPDLLDWLQSELESRGIPVHRYAVEAALEDLEVLPPGAAAPVRLRIVRTGPR